MDTKVLTIIFIKDRYGGHDNGHQKLSIWVGPSCHSLTPDCATPVFLGHSLEGRSTLNKISTLDTIVDNQKYLLYRYGSLV